MWLRQISRRFSGLNVCYFRFANVFWPATNAVICIYFCCFLTCTSTGSERQREKIEISIRSIRKYLAHCLHYFCWSLICYFSIWMQQKLGKRTCRQASKWICLLSKLPTERNRDTHIYVYLEIEKENCRRWPCTWQGFKRQQKDITEL